MLSITNHHGSANQNHHEMPAPMVTIKKTKQKKQKIVSVGRKVEKLECCCFAGGNKEKCVTMESSMMVSMVGHQKAKELSHDPAILLLGINPKELNPGSWPYFYTRVCSSIIDNSQRWKQLKCPLMDGWINTMWSIPPVECDSTLRRKQVLTRPTT